MNTVLKEENVYTAAREHIEMYRKQQYKKKLRIQKIIGILVVVVNILCAYYGNDATAAVVAVPLGLYLIFSKELTVQI